MEGPVGGDAWRVGGAGEEVGGVGDGVGDAGDGEARGCSVTSLEPKNSDTVRIVTFNVSKGDEWSYIIIMQFKNSYYWI